MELPPAQEYQDFTNVKLPETKDTPVQPEPQKDIVADQVDEDEPVPEPEDTNDEQVLADSVNLNVPFMSQAPSKNWDQPFQDACEEASMLMVYYYYSGKSLPGISEQEDILVDMVDWQIDNWGGHYNLPIDTAADLAQATFNYRAEVVENLTPDKVRTYLNKGLPVIVPADGHKLANPYFSNDGPEYHMLVIKGYKDDKFITDDPGTMHGADFVYSEENLFYSIHDWDTKKNQAIGSKVGLVLHPN